MRNIIRVAAAVLTGVFVLLVSLLGFGARWGVTTWGKLQMDEIVFQLQQPLKGTESGILSQYLLKGLLPALLVTAAFAVLQVILRKNRYRALFTAGCFSASLIAAFGVWKYADDNLHVREWLAAQESESVFIEDNYADPARTAIRFPEKKRNLIYIYLESMEVTYADPASGGDFPENLIPELTRVAMENEDFSGAEETLNGGFSAVGSTFTTGAIFSQSTGLPLRIGIGGNNMDTQENFFPGITGLGDILEKEGYRQVFLLGSDASFGGRRLYFQDHGNFEIRDYEYAKDCGWIPADYKVWWGFEDEKLFDFAKETLQELAAGEEPFNLTMLTVDTHFEGGYVCRLCGDEFGDDQYANVMACSSRQVAAFLAWVQEQDFYRDTTVVITGDHPTMSKYFCEDVDENYLRKTYTAVIHPAVSPVDGEKRREYSTFDLFPTTLAAMGVSIEGDRLGLGTNLFSEEQTLLEQYGREKMNAELGAHSAFLEKMEKTNEMSPALLERYQWMVKDGLSAESYDPDTGQLLVRLNRHTSVTVPASMVLEVIAQETGKKDTQTVTLAPDPAASGEYTGTLDLSGWTGLRGEVRVDMVLDDGSRVENLTSLPVNELSLHHEDFAAYLAMLQKYPELSILIAVKDDGTKYLPQDLVQGLRALGLTKAEEIAGQPRISYIARIEGESVDEQAGYDALHMEGVLRDGRTTYTLESGGHDHGNEAVIRIGDTDLAVNHRGFNIVVYDCEDGTLIDSVRFYATGDEED